MTTRFDKTSTGPFTLSLTDVMLIDVNRGNETFLTDEVWNTIVGIHYCIIVCKKHYYIVI